MDKYRTLKQKHAVLKEAYLSLEENVKLITQNSEAKIIDYDCKLSRLSSTLSDRDEQIKSLQDEISNLQINKQIVERRLTNYITNEEIKSSCFFELANIFSKKSIYDDSVDTLYELSCRTNTRNYINFTNKIQKFFTLLNDSINDNQHTTPIEGNVQIKLIRGKLDNLDESIDSLEPLTTLNLDLLRYMDKTKLEITHTINRLHENITLELCNKLIKQFRLYLTIEEYLFPDLYNSTTSLSEDSISNTTSLIKSLYKLYKILENLNNTLLYIHRIINSDIDDMIKVFIWNRSERLLIEINSIIKNIADFISHRMCFPKICNGKFLPLTGSTDTLIQLYELLNGEVDITMNIAIVKTNNINEFQISIDNLILNCINNLNKPKIINKQISNTNICNDFRLKELEVALIKSETNALIANYQRNSLLNQLDIINEITDNINSIKSNLIDGKSKATGSNLDYTSHNLEYVISPISLPINNKSSSELAGYVTTLIKDGISLSEDNVKINNQLESLRIELSKERERREAAEDSCRASINELTRHMSTMEQTIIQYENKISQLKKSIR